MKRKVFCYNDELNDEFSGICRNAMKIDDNYNYNKRCWLWRVFSFVVYRIFVLPFAYLYLKIKFRHKVVGKNKLKACKSKGYFMYGNHTLMAGDAFIPNIINSPRKTYTIVNSDNVSVSSTRWLIEMCGALPLPTTLGATRNFMGVVERKVKCGCAIQIYPEAHIWPYYTGIRPFRSGSFKYPIKYNVPVYSITNTFHRRRLSNTPKVITYIDGPFYVDKNLSQKEQETTLRDIVYGVMCERAKLNTYSVHTYIKGDKADD